MVTRLIVKYDFVNSMVWYGYFVISNSIVWVIDMDEVIWEEFLYTKCTAL